MLKVKNNLVTKIAVLFVLMFVVGSSSLFADALDVGESKTITIHANDPYNYAHIYLQKDKKYKFTVGSPAWNNGSYETDAGGYLSDIPQIMQFRRHKDFKLMALTGEFFSSDNNPTAYTGTYFLIGIGRSSYTAPKSGFLVAFANDCITNPMLSYYPCYTDNSRIVELTIKRIE
jgi:hypothetical protein